MRLNEKEKSAIRRHILTHDPEAAIFLFGSRTDDLAKGGDIDLLVQSSRINFEAKLTILASIKAEIGDQKIDLVLTSDLSSVQDPFIKCILPQAIKL